MERGIYRFYNREDYHHVENLTVGGRLLNSCYNHNYYVNETTEDVILEECDVGNFFNYYRINPNGTETYLGGVPCISGIFGNGHLLPSDAPVEEDGSVKLSTNW